MGRIISSVTITNVAELTKSLRCDALVDTGTSLMVLPSAWKERLGDLESIGEADLETANQQIIKDEVHGPVRIRCSDKVGDGKGRASRLKLMCENQLPPTTLRRDH